MWGRAWTIKRSKKNHKLLNKKKNIFYHFNFLFFHEYLCLLAEAERTSVFAFTPILGFMQLICLEEESWGARERAEKRNGKKSM